MTDDRCRSGSSDPAERCSTRSPTSRTARPRTAPRSARPGPSSLLYTYGPGAIIDLPQLLGDAAGLDDWDRIWSAGDRPSRRSSSRGCCRWSGSTSAPGDAAAPVPVAAQADSATQTRATTSASRRGSSRSGCAAPAATTSARCPGSATPTRHPFRPDLAEFSHEKLSRAGRGGKGQAGSGESPAVPAQHLLDCSNGHLDEFPYTLWVHQGGTCPKAELPDLKMRDATSGRASARPSSATRAAPGVGWPRRKAGRTRQAAPKCRGRHPHLNAFDATCDARPTLIMMGASNLWFASTQSIIVMPRTDAEETEVARRPPARRARRGTGPAVRRTRFRCIRALAVGRRPSTWLGARTRASSRRVADALTPPDAEESDREKLGARGIRWSCWCPSGATCRSRRCSRSSRTRAA